MWDSRRVPVLTGLSGRGVRPVSLLSPTYFGIHLLPNECDKLSVFFVYFLVDCSGVQSSLSQRRPVCLSG